MAERVKRLRLAAEMRWVPTPEDPQSVRQHQRYDCRLGGVLRVASEHDSAVRPVTSGAPAEGIPVSVVDCGKGGLGLKSAVYLPRLCRVNVEVDVGGEKLTAPLKVMRVQMADRGPTYYLGCSLSAPSPEMAGVIDRVVAFVKKGDQAA